MDSVTRQYHKRMPPGDFIWHFRVLTLACALSIYSWKGQQVSDIRRGTRVFAASADGIDRELRALGEITAGGDFAVVWVCTEREWAAAESESREPDGVPWPADDVRVRTDEPAPV